MRVIVCEGNLQDMEAIRLYTGSLEKYLVQCEFYDNSEALLRDIRERDKRADLFIIDVEMPEADGIAVAREIRKKDTKALIVFLANHAQYMADVFEVVTFDYIQKPLTEERLHRLFVKADIYLDMTVMDKGFSFEYRRMHYNIKSGEIFYFEKRGRQLIIYTRHEKYMTNMNLNELWTRLSERDFATIHGSFIVNLKYIKTISGDNVLLEDGTQLHISRSCRRSLIEKHLNYVKRC